MVTQITLTLSQAVRGFFLECRARGLSIHTIKDYRNATNKLIKWLPGDPPIGEVTADDVRRLLDHLGHKPQSYEDALIPRPSKPLSKKSLFNIHIALSALWTWAEREGAVSEHIIRTIPRPKPEKRAIHPYTRAQCVAMLDACEHTRAYLAHGTLTSNARPTALRDQAIIRTLLDTGVRASELCRLTIADADIDNNRIKVMGKGAKERILRTGRRATRSVWRYLAAERDPNLNSDDPLFANNIGERLTRQALGLLIKRTGNRASVPGATPHRFRHTFAINFLRNGGNIYALQASLGHTTLEMVRRYLEIVQADIDSAHSHASPVDNWRV
jgi:site-specific recombinase XerD